MMSIADLREKAAANAAAVELDWNKLKTPAQIAQFEHSVRIGISAIPELENLYIKFASAAVDVSTVTPAGMDSDEYIDILTDELFVAYSIRELYNKFHQINSIIALASGSQ
jgi:hypothetical protein